MQKIALIGAGRGGGALLEALIDSPRVNIVAICDSNPIAAGIGMARTNRIPIYDDHLELLRKHPDIDLLVNVTSDSAMDAVLREKASPNTHFVDGQTARLLFELTTAHINMARDAKRRLIELQDLYELGLKLSSSADLREVYSVILDYATTLIGSPAGSISLFDERTGEMVLAAAKGFSSHFFTVERWKLRAGGLTSHILNQENPIIIPNVHKLKEPVNPALDQEGVQSIIATPLRARGKIIGILYVDDFEPREYSQEASSILGLLSGYAALAIEKMKLLDDTKRLAVTDGLTQLLNQQEFFRRLEDEVLRAARYERPVSLIELDLDFFKRYNDDYGHAAGNDLLRSFAESIQQNSRAADIYARTGGEEFAIILPETSFENAMASADRLRDLVQQLHGSQPEAVRREVTVSLGVATFPIHGQTANDLYKAVDQALYHAKENGRNRVTGYPDQSIEQTSAAASADS